MKGKTLFASVMMGTLLLAGCSAQRTGDAAETQAATAGSENTITLSGSTASCSSSNVTIDGSTIRTVTRRDFRSREERVGGM